NDDGSNFPWRAWRDSRRRGPATSETTRPILPPQQPPFIPHDDSDNMAAILSHWKMRYSRPGRGILQTVEPLATEEMAVPAPVILRQAEIVVFGAKTKEGQLVKRVGPLWFEILKTLKNNPGALDQFDWRKMEELVAGAYKSHGFTEVIVTPRSGDKGRDVI